MSDANSPFLSGVPEAEGAGPDAQDDDALPDEGGGEPDSADDVPSDGVREVPPARVEAGSVHVIVTPGRTRVVLCGEIDAAIGVDLVEAAADAEAAGQPVEVDPRQVDFMDSSGLALIARLATRCPGRLRVIRPPDVVRFLILVTIPDLVDFVDDPADSPGRDTDRGPDTDTSD